MRETTQQPTSNKIPKVPLSAWTAHLVLFLAAACFVYATSEQFGRGTSSNIALGAGVILLISFAAQALISLRAHRTRGTTTAYVFATIGAGAMIWSKFTNSIRSGMSVMSLAIAFLLAGIALLFLEHRRQVHSARPD